MLAQVLAGGPAEDTSGKNLTHLTLFVSEGENTFQEERRKFAFRRNRSSVDFGGLKPVRGTVLEVLSLSRHLLLVFVPTRGDFWVF